MTGNVFGSPVKYELFADMGESEARSVKRTRIVEAFPTVGAKMTFLFDYGDNWQFRIEAIGQNRKEPGGKYPRLLKTIGEAPEQYPTRTMSDGSLCRALYQTTGVQAATALC